MMQPVAKTCSKCGRALPADLEHFYAASELKCGLRSVCRDCDRDRHKSYRKNNPEKVKAWKAAWNKSHPEYMAGYLRRYYAERVGELRAQHAEYRAAHIEEARARNRAYYLANREEHLAQTRAWRDANRERLNELGRVRAKAHPEWSRNRKAREKGAEGSHTADDVRAQYKRQKGECYWCSESVGDDYHVDHVIPLAKGGSNGPENLVIACPSCNLRKWAKLPHEFSDKLC